MADTEMVKRDDELAQYLTGEHVDTGSDPEEVGKQIVAQVLAATTPDEVLAPSEALGARELLDTELEVAGVRWNRSEFDVGSPFYALIDAVRLDTGEKVTITCGGVRVMAQLYKLAQLNAYPQKAIIRQANRPTASGYYPLRLEAPR